MRVKHRPGYLTVPDAARRLGVNYRTVLRMVRDQELRGGRRGHYRAWFVEAASVAAYLAARVDRALDALATTPATTKESEHAVPHPEVPDAATPEQAGQLA